MLKFRLFGIPVLIEWWFWLSAILLGGGMNAQGPEDWKKVALWSVIMFLSVLAHELGHALAGMKFGVRPVIKLHGFGGLTFLTGANFSRMQSIVVSAAGPAVSLLLGFAVLLTASFIQHPSRMARIAIGDALYINFFWTCLNLLPIQPMDGGQILREVLGPKRRRATALIGGALAAGLCILSLKWGQIYLAFMLALFAYHNFRQDQVEGGVVKD